MDRLICGDVGFGKTEVALRAAFLAVLDGKQVAVLVPTTTLAFQHGRTFAARMTPFGINVRTMSRFVSDAERKKIRDELAAGVSEVVIGTHQLLSRHVRFADLGLLIVDEEQLFGVGQKEKIKALRDSVDVMALSATPIPRTLHMSLVGIRDLSVIDTPPEDRLSVRTFITRWDDDTIAEAVRRELGRGGQVFFIHNRIQSIAGVADRVRRLVPEARVRVGHGQMKGEDIEELLIDFAERRYDVLVATTIVGSGLDFPQANTILINRADMLGLAQLYQLRGRVGRSKVRAYCYLIIPGGAAVSADARKRLAAIRTFTELGSGYKIAAKDLEIRGAGNLLGTEQSGHIGAVGFELYRELLDEEIRRMRGEDVDKPPPAEISLPVAAFIPDDYIEEASLRLGTYKRIADAPDAEALGEVEDEIRDRFGPLPAEVGNLFAVMGVKLRAQALGLLSIDHSKDAVVYRIGEKTPIPASRLIELVAGAPARYRLLPDGRLVDKEANLLKKDAVEAVLEGLIALELCVNNRETLNQVP
ncbi:MAG: helicase-related protein [Deltaproteobacteria bacterium]|nr:helicase-related protein [Deltaproteobacteria bacterium]